MKLVRLTLLGLVVCLLGACGASDATGPLLPEDLESTQSCGYLGSAGCPAVPVPDTGV